VMAAEQGSRKERKAMGEAAVDRRELDEFVATARRLRVEADVAERALMEHLIAGEANEDLWRPHGFSAFAEVLSQTDICKPSRYARYKAAKGLLGDDVIAAVGVTGSVLAAEVPDEGARAKVVEHMAAWVAANETALSEQTAKAIRNRHFRPSKRPRVLARMDRVAELDAEVKALRKENRSLHGEVTRLTKALAEAEKKLARSG